MRAAEATVVAWLAAALSVACEARRPGDAHPSATHEVGATRSLSAAGDAQAELSRIDKRSPLPLLPMMANHQKENMRDHLLAVQEVVLALGREDFDAVSTSAQRMGYSPQVAGMCTHMGAGAPGFAERALEFHRRADSVVAAAQQHDKALTLHALGTMLQSCTGCHAAFRQELVAGLPTP